MRLTESIVGKMWLSLGILIAAYFVSILAASVVGRSSERRLQSVSESLFPASSQSQVAMAGFREGTKLYQDAVMTGEPSALSVARVKMDGAKGALQAILDLRAIPPARREEVRQARKRLLDFDREAGVVYGRLSSAEAGGAAGAEGSAAEGASPDTERLWKEKESLEGRLQALAAEFSADLRAELADVAEHMRRQRHLSIGIFAAAVAAAVSLAFIILRRWVAAPVRRATDFVDTMARGDFTARLSSRQNDEVGHLLEGLSRMSVNLGQLVGQVQQSGLQVTTSATELSATARQQEATMVAQVESTDRAARGVGEISEVAAELVRTMQGVAATSEQTAEFASAGRADLVRMEAAMGGMKKASASMASRLTELDARAENISQVVTTITKVASQTNLLSLNAAIEAVKAGEAGKGFTVVAEEIRRLADQTAVAALEIEDTVKAMQSAVSTGVTEMDRFVRDVQQNVESAGRINGQMTRIVEQVQTLSPSFEGVNLAMGRQSEKAGQINAAMVALNAETRQTMESVRQSFAAIEQLNEAALGLQHAVSRFRVQG